MPARLELGRDIGRVGRGTADGRREDAGDDEHVHVRPWRRVPHPWSVTLDSLPSLLFVTQLVDPDDPVLGFVVDQIRALRADGGVIVVANEVRACRPTSRAR